MPPSSQDSVGSDAAGPGADERPLSPAFPVVGVGASAGGLDAFSELLRHLPDDTGMAFVLVQHLDPTHASFLVDLLASKTAMPLVEASDGAVVAPNTVYVVPPAKSMVIQEGALRLTPRPATGVHLPIDYFLESLARESGPSAVAVVLSGTAADGAGGVRAIRDRGGTTMAQDPATAKYPGMPDNAIATGAVDFVLPISLIAKQLTLIAGHAAGSRLGAKASRQPVVAATDPALVDLLALVHFATKADFTHYKQTTVRRRIARRMALRHLGDLEAYLQVLRSDPAEVEALYQDLLIRVTSFFRQPAVFDILKDQVFPEIARSKAGEQVRLWVPGCATGEEAYSLAMAWAESRGADHPEKASFQVFATDINQQAVDKARTGVYPRSIEADVSPERLARFFTVVEGGYRVNERLRETCVFARQDLTRDPPFSRLDLISLRNVLIYLDPLLQRRVLPILHFALRPGGFLLLGESESVSGFTDLFAVREKKAKLYTRQPGPTVPRPFPAGTGTRTTVRESPARQKEANPFQEADRIVLEGYSPVGVLVDADRQIRQFRGHTGQYLESAPGRASHDLFRMAREGLATELRGGLREAEKTGARTTRRGIRILRDGKVVVVGFDVIPIKSPSGEMSFLILFNDAPANGANGLGAPVARATEPLGDAVQPLSDLERELGDLREYARTVLGDKEEANEELRSANEELQSTNEELQSVNEELETTSEEVQAANEELRTLNEEMYALNDELAVLNLETAAKNEMLQELNAALQVRESELMGARDYARSIIDTVREPLLVLDSEFRVVSASPPFYELFGVEPGDTQGKVFFEVAGGQWDDPALREALGRALSDGDFQDFLLEKDVVGRGTRTLLLSGRRIHASGERTPTILLALEDVSERKRAEKALKVSEAGVRHKLESLLSPDGDVADLELTDLIDPVAMQSFLEEFHCLAGIPLAIIDIKGQVLVGVGWADICTRFHRMHPRAREACVDSDTHLTAGVPEGEYKLYKCNHNMWDVATPIMVGGRHMGNAFSGQFFFDDEVIDQDLFKAQAREYGFDEQAYLEALDRVPRLSRETLEEGMSFLARLVGLVSNQTFATIKLARLISERDRLVDELKQTAAQLASQQEELVLRNEELQAAHAETARLLEEESSLLSRLQGTLVDTPPEIPGVMFGHLYRSATHGAQVGGDFYDVFQGADGRVGLLIGDVSGHGVEAARAASLVKDSVRAFAHRFRRPHAVLREASRLLLERKRAGFVSAFLGFLDPETGALTYSCAGHPPPLVVADGRARLLETTGVPLGVYPDAHFRDAEAALVEGCPILLYTDGITEVRRGGVLYGEAGLASSLELLCTHPVEALPSLLLKQALLFSDGVLIDDVAMLAVRYVGKSGWQLGTPA